MMGASGSKHNYGRTRLVCGACESSVLLQTGGYCVVCDYYLCASCLDLHRRRERFRNHNLLIKEALTNRYIIQIYGKECQRKVCMRHVQPIEYYCADHDVIGCMTCMICVHRRCIDILNFIDILNDEAPEITRSHRGRVVTLLKELHGNITETKSEDDTRLPLDRHDAYLFEQALIQGNGKDTCLRINVVGYHAQGKTALVRRLLNQSLEGIESTDGIDVHINKCKVEDGRWEHFQSEHADEECIKHLVDIIKSDTVEKGEVTGTPEKKLVEAGEKTSQAISTKTIYHRNPEQEASKLDTDKYNIASRVSKMLKEPGVGERGTKFMANIWDFGGQYVYYATHQIFHSADAIYLLVFDLSEDLEANIIDCDFPERQEKMKNCLRFWIDSVDAFVSSDDCTKPTVILVGTHKDKFDGDIEMKFEEVIDIFSETEGRKHIHPKHFAVDNTDFSDHVFDQIRKVIYEIAKAHLDHRMIPAKWIPLEMALLSSRKMNILTFGEVVNLDATNSHPIQNVQEIKLFLKYHHAKGTVIYFDEENLNNFIVVNPKYLIDAFKCIISSKRFCKWNRYLHPLWKKLTETAVLEFELVHEVWSQNVFEKNVDTLLMFLQRHRILSEVLLMGETGAIKQQGKYLIPSLLKQSCTDGILKMFMGRTQGTAIAIGFRLDKSTILPLVYERVTAAALGIWPPVKFQGSLMVFRNTGMYLLDKQHVGQIILKDRKGIEISVINQCKPNRVKATVCDHFRRYIESAIAYEFRKLDIGCRTTSFTYYCACNHPDHRSGSGNGSEDIYELEDVIGNDLIRCPDNMGHSIQPKEARDEWFLTERIAEDKEFPDRLVTDKELSRIAESLGENWQILGVRLGVTTDEMQRIRMSHQASGVATTIFYMLLLWKQKSPGEDTLKVLIHAMRDCEQLVVNWDGVRNVLDRF